MATTAGPRGRVRPSAAKVRAAAQNVAVLALLQAALPANLTLTAVALARNALVTPARAVARQPQTVLISGGKMTKALLLARAFHRAGHRVVLVETRKYWLTGHRFSNAVDRFHLVPKPQDEHYAEALLQIVQDEGVDVYVPVSSPAGSVHDAAATRLLAPHCEVLHLDEDTVRTLDDKHAFAELAGSLGLAVPASYRITAPQQVLDVDFAAHQRSFILKSIPYDPVHRLDLTLLPRPTPQETADFVAALPISEDHPWVLQEFVPGDEYCAHATVRGGEVQLYCCSRSSAFQVNYEMVDEPAIEGWVRKLVHALDLTGQVCFDFILADDGTPYAIECNPRTHSAVTLFYDHPDVAEAYLDNARPLIEPTAASRPTYWTYHELWRLLSRPAQVRARLQVIARGKDAIFDWSDPLPFLMVHHAQIPWLLLRNLRRLDGWIRIDFNIGKLVEAGGD